VTPVAGQRLHGTVALVTGASSGIGTATARALSGEGAAVALVARRADRLAALADELTGAGATAVAIVADITEQAQAAYAVQRAVDELGGRLDVVVNNAGTMLNGPIVDAPVEEWDRMVAINVNGLLYVSHAALPHLLRAAESEPRRCADMVNISSIAGRFANRGAGVYNATKFGVHGFTESLRQEVTQRHVRVAVVGPGVTTTELFGHQSQETQDRYTKLFAGVEPLDAEDVAEAITYIVTRDRRVAVNEMIVRPTEQA
jgi:NADP-dependent 3-hydroxy acid dehydrogenase YdfG